MYLITSRFLILCLYSLIQHSLLGLAPFGDHFLSLLSWTNVLLLRIASCVDGESYLEGFANGVTPGK